MKTHINQVMKLATFSLMVLLAFSCGKDTDSGDFDAYVNSMTTFEQPSELSSPEVLSQTEPEQDPANAAYDCFTTTYNAAPGFDELLALDPTSDVIYPGAMLEGNSIPTGEYIPINNDRAPITLSISLQNLAGSPVIEVDDPKLSTVRKGIKEILDQDVVSATPAKVSFEITEVYSQEHINIALGANYRAAGSSVQGSFDFNSSEYSNKFVLKYLQVYYTIDMDSPVQPSDLFKDTPDISDLGATSPVYVSSIAYGRMVLYTIESNSSKTDINAAFSASFNSGGGSIDAGYQKILNESSIKALVIGGSGASAAQTITGPSEVYNFISEGGDYSKDSPGAPLSYKLRFIKRGTPVARVVLTSEYEIRTCELKRSRYKVSLDKIECVKCPDVGNPEIYGSLKAELTVDGVSKGKVHWNKPSDDDAIKVKNDEYIFDPKDYEKTFNVDPNYTTGTIKFSGWLKDKDLGTDDDFGDASSTVNLSTYTSETGTPKILTFLENDNKHHIKVYFTVTKTL